MTEVVQPVATRPDAGGALSTHAVLSRIGRGGVVASSLALSEGEERALRRQCEARRDSYRADILRHLEQGQLNAARRKFRKMVRCTSVRLAALIEAERLQAKAERARAAREGRDPATVRRRTLAELAALLPEVDLFERAASGRLAFIPKSDGTHRPVVSFGLADRACGVLLKHALIPFARAHPRWGCHDRQFLLAGGSHAACRSLREALERAPLDAWFVQLDVERYYEHVNLERLSQFTGLSQVVIRGFVSTGDMVRRGAPKQWEKNRSLFTTPIEVRMPTASLSGPGGVHLDGDRCIAPGSAASPIIGEMVMGHVLREACARMDTPLFLASFSDNIGVLVASEAAADAVLEAMRGALEGHPAGPFPVGKVSKRAVREGFSFLGYRWEKSSNGVVAHPRWAARERFFHEHAHRQHEAWAGDFAAALPDLRRSVRNFAGAFPLWAGRAKWAERQETALFDSLVAYCEARGLTPYASVTGRDWPKVAAAERRRSEPPNPFRWSAPPVADRKVPSIPMSARERARRTTL